MSARGWAALVSLIGLTTVASACTSEAAGIKPIKSAEVYVATINWYVDSVPSPPPTTGSDAAGPLIVYVASESGKAINTQVQASVVAEMASHKDEVTVRFADVRDDALDVDVDGQPVKDDGVLLLVGEVHEGPPPLTIQLIVYNDVADDHPYEMKIFRSGDDVTATAESVVAPG